MTSETASSPSLDPIAGVQEILDKAAMTGTNKLVLLLVLFDLAAERPQDDISIPIEELTDRYIAAHWNFGRPFRGVQLRHSRVNKKRKNNTYARDSTAMQHIYKLGDFLKDNGFHLPLDTSFDSIINSANNSSSLQSALDDLRENVKKDLWRHPVHRLQNIPSTIEPFLFTIQGERLTLLPGVADALVTSSEQLKPIIKIKMAKLVAEYNVTTVGHIHWSTVYDHIFGKATSETKPAKSLISGDEVRHLANRGYTPCDVSGRQHAVPIGNNWGQRFTVSDDNLKGYSFGLDRDIAAHNGLQPDDSLVVPATHAGSVVGEASLIWRLTNINGTVDIGQLSSVLKELGIGKGNKIVIVATPQSCAVLRAEEIPRQQRTAVSDEIRRSLLGRK